MTNNAAERELGNIVLVRKSLLFALRSWQAGAPHADPEAWLGDVLARIADHRITDLRLAI
jgi:hypothetical protein